MDFIYLLFIDRGILNFHSLNRQMKKFPALLNINPNQCIPEKFSIEFVIRIFLPQINLINLMQLFKFGRIFFKYYSQVNTNFIIICYSNNILTNCFKVFIIK